MPQAPRRRRCRPAAFQLFPTISCTQRGQSRTGPCRTVLNCEWQHYNQSQPFRDDAKRTFRSIYKCKTPLRHPPCRLPAIHPLNLFMAHGSALACWYTSILATYHSISEFRRHHRRQARKKTPLLLSPTKTAPLHRTPYAPWNLQSGNFSWASFRECLFSSCQ